MRKMSTGPKEVVFEKAGVFVLPSDVDIVLGFVYSSHTVIYIIKANGMVYVVEGSSRHATRR